MDASAIKEIVSLALSNEPVAEDGSAVIVPNDCEIRDISQFMERPRRFCGRFTTTHLGSFIDYCKSNETDSWALFVHKLGAVAYFDYGTHEKPGWREHRAVFDPELIPEYKLMLEKTMPGVNLTQLEMVDFLEDMGDAISARSGDQDLTLSQAIAGVRNVSIERVKNTDTTVEDMSASRSTLESIEAKSKKHLPTDLSVHVAPVDGMSEHTQMLRVRVIDNNGEPRFMIRRVRDDRHRLEVEEGFSNMVSKAFTDDGVAPKHGPFIGSVG